MQIAQTRDGSRMVVVVVVDLTGRSYRGAITESGNTFMGDPESCSPGKLKK